MKKIIALLLSLAFAGLFHYGYAQSINPETQIQWPRVTGAGTPSKPCTSANYGQPYTNLTNSNTYVCGTSGWVLTGGGGGVAPGGSPGAMQYNNSGVLGGLSGTGLPKLNGTSAPTVATPETDYVTPAGTGTLSNKTLDNPTVTGSVNGTGVVPNAALNVVDPAHGGTGEAGTFTGIRKANSASADTAASPGVDYVTPSQISAIIPPPISGAIARYEMLDATGTTVTDSTNSGNNATFCSGSNAPSWYPYAVNFASTGTAGIGTGFVCVDTPLKTFKTVLIYACVPSLGQTTGSSAAPAVQLAPTILGNNITTDGIFWAWNTQSQYSASPTVFRASTGTQTTATAAAYGQCHVYALTLDTLDHQYVDANETTYSVQGASSGFVTTATGHYRLGMGPNTGFNGWRGVIMYAEFYNTALSAANIGYETARIQQIIAARASAPHYPINANLRGPTMLALGDSETGGLGYTPDLFTSALVLVKPYSIQNWGYAGMTAQDIQLSADLRYTGQIVPGNTLVHLWACTNDAAIPGMTVQTCWNALAGTIRAAQMAGARVIVATMMSRLGAGYDTFKNGINALIRGNAQSMGYAVNDLAAAPAIGADGAGVVGPCFTDGLHLTGPAGAGTCASSLNGAGYVASLTSAAINSIDGSTAANPDTSTSNAYVDTAANTFVIQTPSASATHQLYSCLAMTGRTRTIVNASGSNTITVNPTGSETILGSTSVAPGAIGRYTAILISASTGGCYWLAGQ